MPDLDRPQSADRWLAPLVIPPTNASQKWWRRVNGLLFAATLVVNLYILGVPFLPQLLFIIGSHSGKQQQLEQLLAPTPSPPTDSTSGSSVSRPNHLIVPSMLLDQPVVEGTNMYQALDHGIWRWPNGSTPDKGGNTVLVGHRFTYTQPKGVFYFLNKIAVGDRIGIVWSNKTYSYKVREVKVVAPTETSILNRTDAATLTLYTCTPLWSPKQRLVIRAELANDSPAQPTASLTGATGRNTGVVSL